MDPNRTPAPVIPPLYPGFLINYFTSEQNENDYFDTLDSDTKDYVEKHVEDLSSVNDIKACIDELHGEK
jgi:hypothetical protein